MASLTNSSVDGTRLPVSLYLPNIKEPISTQRTLLPNTRHIPVPARILVYRYVVHQGFGIQINRMTSLRGPLQAHLLLQVFGKVFHTSYPILKIMFIQHFFKTNGYGLQIPAGQPSVSRKALCDDQKVSALCCQLSIV